MRFNIADINRINTCGILYKNKWDHNELSSSDPCYLFGIKELLKWYYKRSNPVENESFIVSLANYHRKNNTEEDQKIAYQKAFRDYISGHFYQNLHDVCLNYRSDLKVSKDDYLEYIIPVFINDVNKPMFIYYDIGKEDKSFFLQKNEIMHNAVWSFYHLNKLPTFVNIWYENHKIHHEFYKVNEDYILKAKKNLITIGKNLKHFIIPTINTCKPCVNLKNCERFSDKKFKKRK
jgi:hypothetical protein